MEVVAKYWTISPVVAVRVNSLVVAAVSWIRAVSAPVKTVRGGEMKKLVRKIDLVDWTVKKSVYCEFGKVVVTNSTVGPVTVITVLRVTKEKEMDVIGMLTKEVLVKVTMDCSVTVEKTVVVVVVNTSVDTRPVDTLLVVVKTVAMAKLVKMVWVLVKTRYLMICSVENVVICRL